MAIESVAKFMPPGPAGPFHGAIDNLTQSLDPKLVTHGNVRPPTNFVAQFAPRLAEPQLVDAEELMQLIGALEEMVAREGVKTGSEVIRLNSLQRTELAQKAYDQMVLMTRKAKEAADAKPDPAATWWQTALTIFGAVAAVVVAGAAVIGSGGVAAPVAVVLCVGAALALLECANMGLRSGDITYDNAAGEARNLDLGIGGLVEAIVDAQTVKDPDQASYGSIVVLKTNADGAFLDKKGNKLSSEALSKIRDKIGPFGQILNENGLSAWKMGWTTGASLAIALLMLGVGIAGGGATAEGAKRFGEAMVKNVGYLERVAEGMQTASEAGVAGTQVYQGTMQIIIADIQADSEKSRAWKAYFEDLLKDLAQRMQLSQEALREILARFTEGFERICASVQETSEVQAQIANNLKSPS